MGDIQNTMELNYFPDAQNLLLFLAATFSESDAAGSNANQIDCKQTCTLLLRE